MVDQTFIHAFYWFFMNQYVLLFSITMLLSVVTLIAFLTILKTWGD